MGGNYGYDSKAEKIRDLSRIVYDLKKRVDSLEKEIANLKTPKRKEGDAITFEEAKEEGLWVTVEHGNGLNAIRFNPETKMWDYREESGNVYLSFWESSRWLNKDVLWRVAKQVKERK